MKLLCALQMLAALLATSTLTDAARRGSSSLPMQARDEALSDRSTPAEGEYVLLADDGAEQASVVVNQGGVAAADEDSLLKLHAWLDEYFERKDAGQPQPVVPQALVQQVAHKQYFKQAGGRQPIAQASHVHQVQLAAPDSYFKQAVSQSRPQQAVSRYRPQEAGADAYIQPAVAPEAYYQQAVAAAYPYQQAVHPFYRSGYQISKASPYGQAYQQYQPSYAQGYQHPGYQHQGYQQQAYQQSYRPKPQQFSPPGYNVNPGYNGYPGFGGVGYAGYNPYAAMAAIPYAAYAYNAYMQSLRSAMPGVATPTPTPPPTLKHVEPADVAAPGFNGFTGQAPHDADAAVATLPGDSLAALLSSLGPAQRRAQSAQAEAQHAQHEAHAQHEKLEKQAQQEQRVGEQHTQQVVKSGAQHGEHAQLEAKLHMDLEQQQRALEALRDYQAQQAQLKAEHELRLREAGEEGEFGEGREAEGKQMLYGAYRGALGA